MVGERNVWVSGGIGTGDGTGVGDRVMGAVVGEGSALVGVRSGDTFTTVLREADGDAIGPDPLEHPATTTSTTLARTVPVPTLRVTAGPPRR
jgi:hypothetical protein